MCRDGDALMHPNLVERISNKKEQNITLSDIADNNNGNGYYNKSIKGDFIDITLHGDKYVTEINVVGDNVEMFTLELTDNNRESQKFFVIINGIEFIVFFFFLIY